MPDNWPICCRCKKEITVPAYIKIMPAIILQEFFTQVPPIFKCPEQAEDYAKTMIFHDDCWLEELKDHGIEIHDMQELFNQKAKEQLESLVKQGEK